jgi:hypothetical protein
MRAAEFNAALGEQGLREEYSALPKGKRDKIARANIDRPLSARETIARVETVAEVQLVLHQARDRGVPPSTMRKLERAADARIREILTAGVAVPMRVVRRRSVELAR